MQMIDAEIQNLMQELAALMHTEAVRVAGESWKEMELDTRCAPDGSSRSFQLLLVTTNGITRPVQPSPGIHEVTHKMWQRNPIDHRGLGGFRSTTGDAWYGLTVRVSLEGECSIDYNYDPDCLSKLAEESAGREVHALSSKFIDLYLQHVASSFDKQLQFQEVLANASGSIEIDFSTSELIIPLGANTQRVGAQFIGQECNGETWTWSWAQKGLPAKGLELVGRLRGYGQMHGYSELSTPTLPMSDPMLGNMFAMVALGLSKRRAYIRKGFNNGPAFVVLSDPEQPYEGNPVTRVTTVFPQLISTFDVPDHRRALEAYLRFYSFQTSARDNDIVGELGNVRVLASFDRMNRLVNLTART